MSISPGKSRRLGNTRLFSGLCCSKHKPVSLGLEASSQSSPTVHLRLNTPIPLHLSMKRQRCTLQDDEMELGTARHTKLKETNPNQSHELLHKASLLNVDEYTLAEMLRFVYNDDLLNLCFIGNKRFASLYKSAAISIRYVCRHAVDQTRTGFHCLDKCIQNGFFPKLKEMYLRVPSRHCGETQSKLKLPALPSSLTKLTLKNTNVALHVTDVYIANLSSLRVLVLQDITNNVVSGGIIKWLNDVFGVAKHLERLTYFPGEFDQLDLSRLADILPKSLTVLSLHVDVIQIMTPEQWPPYLNTLAIRMKGYSHTPEDISPFKIPLTVTSLKVTAVGTEPTDIDQYLTHAFFLSHPSQLHHLSLKMLCEATHVMTCISKLTSLKSLRLVWPFIQMPKLDFSLLPRSLTRLDTLTPIDPAQWKHLPPGLIIKQLCEGHSIFRISFAHKEAQLQYLPTNITEVEVHHRPLPVVLPKLKSIVFRSIPDNQFGRLHANHYLTNLPSSLTRLSVTAITNHDMFWLHNNGSESSHFTVRFPNLTTVKVELNTDHFKDVAGLKAWFEHLPYTLSSLSLMLRSTYAITRLSDVTMSINTSRRCLNELNDSVRVIDMRAVMLPRLLETFEFSCLPHTLILPKCLPPCLNDLRLRYGCANIHVDAVAAYRKQLKSCDLLAAGIKDPVADTGFKWIASSTGRRQSLDDIDTVTDDEVSIPQ